MTTTGRHPGLPGALPGNLSQPKELVSPFALLLLAERPCHGYALAERLKALGFHWEGSGPLYPRLRQLEMAGLVRSNLMSGGSGPLRRMYDLTPTGRAALARYSRSIHALSRTLDRLLSQCTRPESVLH